MTLRKREIERRIAAVAAAGLPIRAVRFVDGAMIIDTDVSRPQGEADAEAQAEDWARRTAGRAHRAQAGRT